jgi:hypothetical protein
LWHNVAVKPKSVRSKSVVLRMRVTSADARQWKDAAKREKRTLSDWMRLHLREAAVPERRAPAKEKNP